MKIVSIPSSQFYELTRHYVILYHLIYLFFFYWNCRKFQDLISVQLFQTVDNIYRVNENDLLVVALHLKYLEYLQLIKSDGFPTDDWGGNLSPES